MINDNLSNFTEVEKMFIHLFFNNVRIKRYDEHIYYISNIDNLWLFQYDEISKTLYFSVHSVFDKFKNIHAYYFTITHVDLFKKFLHDFFVYKLGVSNIKVDTHNLDLEYILDKYVV